MFKGSFFSSRSTKEILLKEIVSKLSISETEKEIYILSLEILDDEDFEIFYFKITSQFQEKKDSLSHSIEPLTTKLI